MRRIVDVGDGRGRILSSSISPVPGGASLILMMDAAASRVVLFPPVAVGRDAVETEAASTAVFSSATAAEGAVSTIFSVVTAATDSAATGAVAAFCLVLCVDFLGILICCLVGDAFGDAFALSRGWHEMNYGCQQVVV